MSGIHAVDFSIRVCLNVLQLLHHFEDIWVSTMETIVEVMMKRFARICSSDCGRVWISPHFWRKGRLCTHIRVQHVVGKVHTSLVVWHVVQIIKSKSIPRSNKHQSKKSFQPRPKLRIGILVFSVESKRHNLPVPRLAEMKMTPFYRDIRPNVSHSLMNCFLEIKMNDVKLHVQAMVDSQSLDLSEHFCVNMSCFGWQKNEHAWNVLPIFVGMQRVNLMEMRRACLECTIAKNLSLSVTK